MVTFVNIVIRRDGIANCVYSPLLTTSKANAEGIVMKEEKASRLRVERKKDGVAGGNLGGSGRAVTKMDGGPRSRKAEGRDRGPLEGR